MREAAPACMDIAAGEYGYTTDYFRRMLAAQAVDVQQADVTRCGGYTGFLQVAALCEAQHIDLSGTLRAVDALARGLCGAALSPSGMVSRSRAHRADAVRRRPARPDGVIRPDWSRPGLGLEFKHQDAKRYAA